LALQDERLKGVFVRLAIVTGADRVYFDMMHELLATLSASDLGADCSINVLDFGLLPEQVDLAERCHATVVRPTWLFEAPDALRTQANLGYATRPMLPRYFPGHDMYLWADADVSVQDAGFIAPFVAAASNGALAIAEEVDRSYRFEPYALKWQIGNALRCFGLRRGLTLCLKRPINSGIFALRGDAPHWSVWQQRYQQAVRRAGRVNLDQHALMAALYLDGLPCHYLNSTHNWICTRSQPLWDDTRQVFCRPDPPHDPISALHLAGRYKNRLWDIKTLEGKTRPMHLSYADSKDPTPTGEPKAA
jgi:hypothetical protein